MPIRSSRSPTAPLLVVLLATAWATAPAWAQSTQVVDLAAPAGATPILPGGTASIVVTVTNHAPAPVKVTLLAPDGTVPVGWFYDFAPQNMSVASANNSTLTLSAPASAAPGTNVTLKFLAQETDTQLALSDILPINVTVIAPPTPETKETPPRVTLSVSPASAPQGSVVDAAATLVSGEPSDLVASLAIDGKSSWFPHVKDGIKDITLHPGTPQTVHFLVTVPASATPGTVEPFTLSAIVGSSTFRETWTVTALAASAPPSASGTPTGDASSPIVTSPTPTTTTTPAPTLGLLAFPSVESLDVGPGESATAAVRLQNTGTQALHLRLVGSAGDSSWPFSLASDTLDLVGGASRDVKFTLTAPREIAPGGTASARVIVSDASGLLRTVPFTLKIVPPLTRSDQPAATESAPLPTPPATGISPVTATLVLGLGAVGAGALALANRPLREKLAWGAVGLYTRLARPDVLGHEERQKLYKLIETRPGTHFHALQRELNWNTGTLTYHLRVLERHGFVVDRRDGAFRRFYLSGAAPRKETFSADAPQGLRADVLEAVRNHHGISQSDLALALGANKQTVNYHVKALERQGILRVEKRGRDTYLYPTNAPGMGPGEVPA